MKKFKKITEELYSELEEKDELINILAENIQHFYIGNISNKQILIKEALIDCESPIEQLLAMELEGINLNEFSYFNKNIDVLAIEKQTTIKLNGKNYRPDFLIPVSVNKKLVNIIVECDGYNWHKDNFTSDKERDRAFTENGYIVVRFSGSEIIKSPYKCARQIQRIILNLADA